MDEYSPQETDADEEAFLEEERPDALPDFANAENRAIYEQVKRAENRLQELRDSLREHEQRVLVMVDHLKNVDTELIHTQALLNSKRKENETEQHLIKLADKETSRFMDDLNKIQEKVFDYRHKINVINNEMFGAKEKVEEFRIRMEWTEDELEQWTMARKQKEDDQLVLEQYRRADEAKVVSMNVQIQRLSKQLQGTRKNLEKEVTETQASQIELDNTTIEFKQLHDSRMQLNELNNETLEQIRRKDRQIQNAQIVTKGIHDVQEEKEADLKKHQQLIAQLKKTMKKNTQNVEREERQLDLVRSKLHGKREMAETLEDEFTLKQTELQKAESDIKDIKKVRETLQDKF